MRIDGFQNIPAILQSFKTNKSTQSSSGANETETSSSVSLSSFAGVLQSLQRESTQADKARHSNVERLAQQEASGGVPVDTQKIAEKLLDAGVLDL
jgi:flagellar biosynthesis anti-sigma factor FlgM